MSHTVRTLAAGLLIALPLQPGCAAPKPAAPPSDEKIEIADVPAGVLDAAKKKQPGVEFQWAKKGWQDGVLVYKVQGESGEGKIHEVQVTAAGEVLAPTTP